MSDDGVRQDDTVENGTDEPPWSLRWPWPGLFFARLAPNSKDTHGQDLPLLLAPNQHGLDVLEGLDTDVESIWIVSPPATGSGGMVTETVQKICRWSLLQAPDEVLSALYCKSGAVFVVDEQHLYQVDEVWNDWSAGNKYMPAGPKEVVLTIEAVVVAIAPDFQVAKVQTAAGDEYSISRDTGGISLDELHKGTRVRCIVTRKVPSEVLRASVLA